MKRIPPLSPIITMHLRKKFPGNNRIELELLNTSAWCWVSGRVFHAHLDPEPHPLLVAAATLYMCHLLEREPRAKAAHLYNAHELLSLFS